MSRWLILCFRLEVSSEELSNTELFVGGVLLKMLNIPVILISNMLRPVKKVVQNKGAKTGNSQTGELLQFELPKGVSEAKKMQKDHDTCPHFTSSTYRDQA